MKLTTTLVLTVLLAVAIPLMAQPQGPKTPGPNPPEGRGGPPWMQKIAAFRQQRGPGGPGMQAPGPKMAMVHRRMGGQGWGRHEGKRHEGKHMPDIRLLLAPQVREKLNITDDQAKKIKDLALNTEKQKIQLEARIKTAEVDVKAGLFEKRPDRDKVLAQVDEIAKAKTELAKLMVQEHLDARQILTDDQIDKITKLIQEKMAMHHRGMAGACRPGMCRPGMGGFGMRGKGGPGGPGGPMMERMRERWGGGAGGPGMPGREEMRRKMEERRELKPGLQGAPQQRPGGPDQGQGPGPRAGRGPRGGRGPGQGGEAAPATPPTAPQGGTQAPI